jgi:hypothetical protein
MALVLALTSIMAVGCGGDGLSISLTQDQLQRIVEAVFPLEGEREAVGVTLTGPMVTLEEGSDRIAFGLDISVSVVLEPGEGPLAGAVDERAEQRAAEAETAPAEEGRGARARNKVKDKAQEKTQDRREEAQERAQERAVERGPTQLTGTVTVSTAVRYEASTGELFLTDFQIEELDVEQLPGRFNEPVTNLASRLISDSLNQVAIYQIDDSNLGGSIARALLNEVIVENGVLTISVGLT